MSVLNTNQASDVLVTEINLSQVITSVSSAVAGLVVVSKQGQTTPQRFTNANDFLAQYGNPNAQISFDVYCGLDFFGEGNDMWAVRAVGSGALYSAILLYQDGATTKAIGITAGVADPTFPDFDALVPSGGTPLALFYPNKGPGSYGDSIAIGIASSNIDPPTGVAVNSSTSGGTLAPATYSYQVSALSATGETLASSAVQVVIAAGSVTNSVTVSWDNIPKAYGYLIYGRTTGAIGFIEQVGAGVTSFVDTGAITPDTTKPPKTSAADAPPVNPIFTVNIYDTSINSSTPVESYDCSLLPGTDASGTATELSERINPYSQYVQVTSDADALVTVPTVTSVAQTLFTGGDSGAVPTEFNVAAAWNTFSNTQLYSVNSLINSGHSTPTVQLAMDTLAQKRQDAVGLLDVPSASQQFQAAINYRRLDLNLNSTYSALFCPDVLEADNINGKQQYVPFSGWAAALCARTDRVANPSFSIAGLNRGLVNVLKTRYTYDDGQSTALYQAQVNYTRTFIGQGIALWEQQTLAAQQSALSFLSVRRIVNVIKKSIYQFLLYSLQEPNDDFTGRQIVGATSDYLETVKNARAIQGYEVYSDSRNNTAAMFNSAIRRVTVIIVPTLPIHIIDLQVVISKQGVNFDEVLASAQT